MTTSPDTLARLVELQAKLAAVDPSLANLDPTDSEDALSIALIGAVLAASQDGKPILLTTVDENGRKETLGIEPMGSDSTGQGVFVAGMTSSDGTLSPEGAKVAAALRGEIPLVETE